MPNQGGRIMDLNGQGMHNCDIVRKHGAAPPNVRMAIERLKELGYTGDRPRSGRKRQINTTRNRQLIKNAYN